MISSTKLPWIITVVAVTAAAAVVVATLSGWIGGGSASLTDDLTADETAPDVDDQCMARAIAAEAATAVWTAPRDIARRARESEAAEAWTDAFKVWPIYADAWAAAIACYSIGSDRYWCSYDADRARDGIDSAVRSARIAVDAYAAYLLEADRKSGEGVVDDLIDLLDAYGVVVQAVNVAIEASTAAYNAITSAAQCYDLPV